MIKKKFQSFFLSFLSTFRDLNAIIHDNQVLLHYISKENDCSLQIAGEPMKDAGYAFAVRKGDPTKDRLSEQIRNYQQDGTIQKLTERWISSKCVDTQSSSFSSSSENDNSVEETSISYFGGLFIILAAGCFVSFLVLCCELYMKRRELKRVALTRKEYIMTLSSRKKVLSTEI